MINFKEIKQHPQVQYDLNRQLKEASFLADIYGLYGAGTFIRSLLGDERVVLTSFTLKELDEITGGGTIDILKSFKEDDGRLYTDFKVEVDDVNQKAYISALKKY